MYYSFLKDRSIQSLISNALFNLSFLHTLFHYTKEPLKLAEKYPTIRSDDSAITAYRRHLLFHLMIVLKVFFRSLLTVYVTFLVVIAIKLVVVDLTHAALEDKENVKGHKKENKQRKNTDDKVSVGDVHDLMTRSLWKDNGLFRLLQMLVAQGIAAFIVATFVSDPGSMKIASHRLINVRVFLGSLMIVQIIVVASMNL
jgi:hypothetical protein